MPQLVSLISGADWTSFGPTTPAQRFYKDYVDAVDNHGFTHGSGLRYYAKDAIFHNQNNAQYKGGDEMWAWMKKLFGQFQRLRHDHVSICEIRHEDGTAQIMSQSHRNIWLSGNSTDKPSVSIPLCFVCRIGPADDPRAISGLQYKEVWLYWDTALLSPFLPEDAIVFRTKNILTDPEEH
ncbi:hypothetical protein BGW36DRAFT_462978 [Talaromyces proteolyticus]|uniref:SnoaL-like domain-containing protein n=1 Tax=Talaromyces proteolyticus TaxID=1131652 RepID=A0AAD4KND3_9EURO|nr:uncharacterized protein BGW36DRAFT_462978 [Talaromyces proteolyticus]KAH8695379.1 hypothetical protein BGW36DRAFT_462978 [Talaromyces proteolyticus]